MPRPVLAHVAATVIAISGCSEDAFSGDPFPIHADQASGAMLVELSRGPVAVTASFDVLAPITVVDPGPGLPVRRRSETLTVRAVGSRTEADAGFVDRARLAATVFEMHPCSTSTCQVGGEDGVRDIGAIIGADSLAGDAVRFDFPSGDVFILPDIAGENSARNRICDAVFQAPYRGGGTLLIDGAEIPFGGRRVALGVCAGAAPRVLDQPDEAPSGADLLLVMSTGVGITILGQSGYQRWLDARPRGSTPPATRPGWAMLASGRVDGVVATLPSLSLTATAGSDPRGPCREVWAHKVVSVRNCEPDEPEDTCACGGTDFCGAPAILDLRPADGIPVLVVADSDPTLQSLRAELRPDQAEVDGILGTDALRSAQVDVDYPHNRVLARCGDRTSCQAWPQLVESSDRETIVKPRISNGLATPGAPDAGVADAGVADDAMVP